MAVTKRLRYEILKRDIFTCRYCGASAPEAKLTVDHVLPTALGGSDDPHNLVAACHDCNAGKTSSNPGDDLVADVDQERVRAKAAIAEAISRRRVRHKVVDDIVDEVYTLWPDGDPDSYGALLWMIKCGLDAADFRRATAITESKRDVPKYARWRYFMGVCRHMVAEIEEEAQQIMLDEVRGNGA